MFLKVTVCHSSEVGILLVIVQGLHQNKSTFYHSLTRCSDALKSGLSKFLSLFANALVFFCLYQTFMIYKMREVRTGENSVNYVVRV